MHTLRIWLFFETRLLPTIPGSALLSHRLSQISFKYPGPTKGATAQWWLQKMLPVTPQAPAASLEQPPLHWQSLPVLPQGRANIPNLSQLEERTAGCCLPGETGASFGMLSLTLRNKQPGFHHQGKGSSRAAAQADKSRGICKETSSFNRKWNTHFFHDRTGHTRVF